LAAVAPRRLNTMPITPSQAVSVEKREKSGRTWTAGMVAALAALCTGGCFISPNPFFDPGDVVQDENLVGSFSDRQEEVAWRVLPSSAQAGRYEVLLIDHEAVSRCLATLFRIGTGTYLDVAAIGKIAIHVDQSGSPDSPTVSQMMNQMVGDGRHLVLKVSVEKMGVTYWVASPDALRRLLRDEFGPQPRSVSAYMYQLDRPTKDLRAILMKYGAGDIMFTEKKVLPREMASPPAAEAPAAKRAM
jgi:hypothetical protein